MSVTSRRLIPRARVRAGCFAYLSRPDQAYNHTRRPNDRVRSSPPRSSLPPGPFPDHRYVRLRMINPIRRQIGRASSATIMTRALLYVHLWRVSWCYVNNRRSHVGHIRRFASFTQTDRRTHTHTQAASTGARHRSGFCSARARPRVNQRSMRNYGRD